MSAKPRFMFNTPIFHISRLLCMFSECKSYLFMFYSFIFVSIFLTFYAIQVHHIIKYENNTNALLYLGYASINVLFVITCIVNYLIQGNSICIIYDNLVKIQEKLSAYYKSIKNYRKIIRQIIQIMFIIITTGSFFLLYTYALRENLFPSFFPECEFYILIINWLIIFQIDYFFLILGDKFNVINRELEILLKAKPKIEMTDILIINRLNSIHYCLYQIFKNINSCYRLQLLIMIPRVIFFTVLPLYYNIISALVRNPQDANSSQLWTHLFTLVYILLLLAPIIFIVSKSTELVCKGCRINLLVHDFIDEDQDEAIENELLLISVQLLHRNIEFSIYQFFALEPSLTTNVIELIVTYVIILLQFQDTLSSAPSTRLLLHSYPSSRNRTLFNNFNVTH